MEKASRIRVLPESVARRIAAGEVVERPVSVAKELVENSIDAGARSITVEIEEGGRRKIAVADDGEGMSREDAALAFRPHATSKIQSAEDLLRVSTLGFRGEALPSIAAVSTVEVWTRRPGDAAGAHLEIRGGRILAVEDAGTAAGCRVEVRDLFFNTPVRRKFLKGAGTEAGHVAQWVGRMALARCDIGFTLLQDGRETLALPRSDLRTRIRRILGRDSEAEMRPVACAGAVSVSGFATHPHHSSASQRGILLFVNGRLVRDRVLLHALLAAYSTLLPHGRYPAAVLFVALPAEDVDVNVHPAKLEVRFRSPPSVHEAIGRAIRWSLHSAAAGPVTSVAEPSAAYGADADRAPGGRLELVPRGVSGAPEPASLFPAPGPFSRLRVVGQVFEGYLVCEGTGEIVLIDQHAAHERVVFERLREQHRRGGIEAQALLVPQSVELSPGEVEHLTAAAPRLAALGLEVEAFGDRSLRVRSVPALFSSADATPLLRALATDLAEVESSRAVEDRTEGFLATIACHSAVRVGRSLSAGEILGLLSAMDSIDLHTNCPHGRPVTTRLSRTELERRFGR